MQTRSSKLPVLQAGVVCVMCQPGSGAWFVMAGLTKRACGRVLLPQFYPAGLYAGDLQAVRPMWAVWPHVSHHICAVRPGGSCVGSKPMS